MLLKLYHLPHFLLASVLLLSGCVTHYPYPDVSERTDITLDHLYFESHTMATSNGVRRYVLVPDTRFVSAVEGILQHYAIHSHGEQRRTAGAYLAKFGTVPAFEQALAMAQTDPDPKMRAELWEAIIQLLPNPRNYPWSVITTNASDSSILSTPTILPTIWIWHGDAVLPPGLLEEDIESSIISQYRSDDGFWDEIFIDRIPFVPFSGRQYTERITVRQRIAESLYVDQCSTTLINAFREFSQDPDPAISEFAKPMVKEWARKNSKNSATE